MMAATQRALKVFDVERHGPPRGTRVGGGDPDVDTAALRNAVAAASAEPNSAVVLLPRATTYWTHTPLVPTRGITWRGVAGGGARLAMWPGATWRHLIEAANCPGITFEDLWLDRLGSKAPPSAHVLGTVRLFRCDDARAERVTVSGARGVTGGGSGVGFAAGECQRTVIRDSTARDCMIADGFYVGIADDCLIERVTGERVQDTVAVLEGCSRSTIRTVRARDIGCAAGISNITDVDKGGNVMDGVRATICNAYSGAIRVGCVSVDPRAVGNLVDTSIRNVEVDNVTGPGLVVVENAGKVDGLTIDRLTVRTCSLQGMLLTARRVRATGVRIFRPGASGVQVEPGSRDINIRCEVETAAVVGISVTDAADVTLRATVRGVGGRVAYGAYFYGRNANARISVSTVGAARSAGSDAGTVLRALTPP